MPDDAKLMPPISRINERLTALSREQRRLRALLALAVEAKTDAETRGSDARLARRKKTATTSTQ
jgi:hypothetical protein